MKLKLSKSQYHFLASWFKTLSEGTILGSSAVLFLPETFQLATHMSLVRYALFLAVGLTFLIMGVILEQKGEGKND